MSGIQTKDVIKYAVLPGIIPRLKALFTSGFGYVALLMAQIYAMVRLLPADHPYLNPRNTGRYGIRHVIAESANSLVISTRNIDQLIVFILMLTCIVLIAGQLALLAISLIFEPVWAAPPPPPSLFLTANPTYDIAFTLLDQVFGVGDGASNFFNSCVAQSISCDPDDPTLTTGPFPWPFHLALHNMFRFYSLGILLIGTLIFLYFLVVVIVETATTGTPFGQRFQNIWVPIRLVVAIGLLIPLSFGYNAGQYITFAAAKYGSSFATYAWTEYNQAINSSMPGGTGNPLGEKENLIAMPKPPEAAVMAEFLSIVHACAFAHYHYNDKITKGIDSSEAGTLRADLPETNPNRYLNNNMAVKPFLIKTPQAWQSDQTTVLEVTSTTSYKNAIDFYTGGDIVIRFGRQGNIDVDESGGTPSTQEEKLYEDQAGQVEPTCGEIRIPITDRRPTDNNNVHTPTSGSPSDGYLGTVAVQRMYFEIVRDHWHNFPNSENYIDFAGRFVFLESNKKRDQNNNACSMGCSGANAYLPNGGCGTTHDFTNKLNPDMRGCATEPISSRWRQDAINTLQIEINDRITVIWNDYNEQTNEFDMDPLLLQRGWGGAGIWFNTLARVNGAFVAALLDFPTMDRYPRIMEAIAAEKKEKDPDATGYKKFNPNIKGDAGKIELSGFTTSADAIGGILYEVIAYWNEGPKNMAKTEKVITSGALETGMNLVFGTYGLFAMTDENANIHPLSQLVTLGKGLVESAVRNVAGSSMAAALGGFTRAIDSQAGSLVEAAGSFLLSTAFIGLTAGFVLFYVLPFLPFVYFYFAVASWIKSIFEAMVGVPLWALAHLRLDGDGLPGESAANGYFLIFEIFIRPILTVAGLIAAMLIFTAQVRVLNFIWPIVTENVGGHNSDATIGVVGNINFKRSIVDQFFYTVVYAIIVYLLATTSFKLIDKIPDNLLRWMGQGVSSFGDINQDPTESLTRYAALGGMTAGRQAAQGVQQLSGGVGGTLGQALSTGPATTQGSDIRLKENIEHLGYENGIPVYIFSYIGEAQRYKGVMAQDILKIKPEAVVEREDGYMAVYYDQLGIEMEPFNKRIHKKALYNA